MKSTNQNGRTKQSKESVEESIKIIIAACLFPFIMFFFLIIAGMIFLIIMSHIPQKGIPHEEKESVAIETVTQYIEEKYGNVLTYSGVEKGTTAIFKGNIYRDVKFVNDEGIMFNFRVFEDYENECMYIESETYYCYYIKDRMMEWMDSYLKESSLEEYVLEYNLGRELSTEWELDYSAEEIVNELLNKKGGIRFKLSIPERERNIYDSGQLIQELNELVPYLDKDVCIYIYVYENQVYDEHKDKLQDEHYIDFMTLEENDKDGY
ncbi:MAG: hypothetical protein IJA10_02830 [Lachnospiraceae bacterium]|nr:hypothetical protein [Lachnospiraceae bacterium]